MLDHPTTFSPGALCGELGVPGDKSISHRALIAGAALRTPLRVTNLNPGRDVHATAQALVAIGARIERSGSEAIVEGAPLHDPSGPIDCMNSGSTARMLLGVCAGAGIAATFDGDASLRRRPMEPVAAQLRAFGARIETNDGCMPVRLHARTQVETKHFILLSPSAQVKSALLFAALFAGVAIVVDGDRGSRDHTERLLRYLGADIEGNGRTIALRPAQLEGKPIEVAGDFSSAAFFITAATITPGSRVVIRGVGVNPTRTGLLEALEAMGARIERQNPRMLGGEPVADLAVEHAPLRAAAIAPDVALRAIDEIPLVAVAAAFACGDTKITGVKELRSKESDRVAAIERLLGAVGIGVESSANGLSIAGGQPAATGAIVDTHHDHRTAMAAAVLACAAGPVGVDSTASIDVSFPSFLSTLASVRA